MAYSDAPADPAWQRLKTDIEGSVRLQTTQVTLGGQEFVWYRVADPDQLLQAAVSSGQEPELVDPFWAATWRAALGIDHFLRRMDIHGVRILELGCGSGQAGVAAAARGARVTLTDAVPLALQVARLNAWPVRLQVDFQSLRWDLDRLEEPAFPVIIGSDLVYDPALFARLEACARQHLDPLGQLLLSEPHRHTGDKFAKWIRQAGWKVVEHDIDLADRRIAIRIFQCRLP